MGTMEKEYGKFYSLPEEYRFTGKRFLSGREDIWSWCLEPERWNRTAVVLHGVLDHSLSNRTLILWLLKRGYRVVAGDMPGHGRSSGIRGGIDSFEDYTPYFHGLLAAWDVDPGESWAIGHSTGSSILINYARDRGIPFRGMVLAAPLVKMNFHVLIDKSIDLAQDWIQDIPVKKTKSSHCKSFLKFKWNDPLGVKRFSLTWFRAMVEWNRTWTDFSSDQRVLILQGRKDRVVEWRSNMAILERCFTDCRLVYIKKGKHHILNESDRIKKEVYAELERFLEDS